MYIPKYYKINERNEIFDFINDNSFAILITRNEGELVASHLPLLLKSDEGENGTIYGHMAKANHQWKGIQGEVLAIFPGAHKYISSSWYETNQSVPTWNYISVHAYGKIEILEDREIKEKIIRETVKFFESPESAYSVDNLKETFFDGLLRGITAFRIEISRLEGKKKMSQNHSEERQERVINKLEGFSDEDSKEIAARMKKNLNKDNER